MLKQVRKQVAIKEPRQLPLDMPEAAVMITLTDEEDRPEIILTERAANLNSHAGEVAFPGGKKDDTDSDLLYTAKRECFEEMGFDMSAYDVLGSLNQIPSRKGILVTPFVSVVDKSIEETPNPGEIASVFRVPLDFFMDAEPEIVYRYQNAGVDIKVPSFSFEGYKIWGLTAFILVDLLHTSFGMFEEYTAPY